VQDPKRAQRLLDALGLPFAKLSESQSQELVALVREYSDVFALDDSELGCTDLVKHSIDTGDHPPCETATISYTSSVP